MKDGHLTMRCKGRRRGIYRLRRLYGQRLRWTLRGDGRAPLISMPLAVQEYNR